MEINALKKHASLAVLLFAALLCSCDDANNTYCDITARLYLSNVSSYPVLSTACTSLGEFCTITLPGSTELIAKNYNQSSRIAITADMRRNGIILGLNGGLIIGLPSTPEMLKESSQVVCFDLSCPNCYKDYNFTKQMSLGKNNDQVYCSSCQRTYDLNNSGIVCSGEAGRSLLRYPITYYPVSMTISVSNR